MAEPAAPRWARGADLLCIALAALAAFVAASGGFRLRLGGARLSLTSPARLLLAATVIAAVRHVFSRSVPIHRDLPNRIGEWRRAFLSSRLVVSDVPPAAESQRSTVAFLGGVLVLMTVVTIVLTYPQIRHMRDGVYDPGDPLLNLWALSWVAHALPTAPGHLFDANIFVPERYTLAYSETLLAPSLLAAPLLWLGLGRIFVYNVVLLSGFILSGVGMALLVRELTRSTGAAVVSGVVFASLPFRFDHIAQLQLQQAQWIPLAFWALHRLLTSGRIRDGMWLGASVAGQLLSCMYYGIFLAAYLVVVGGLLLMSTPSLIRKRLAALVAAVGLAIVLFAPAASAYLNARSVVGERGAGEIAAFSATWSDYLAAPDNNRLFGWTAERFGALDRRLFPGLVAPLLAAVALWPPWSLVRAAYAVGLLFAIDLTLGFNGLSYRFLFDYLPPFRALRIPALAVVLVGFSLAVLAGFGIARLSPWFRSAAARAIAAALVCLTVAAESWSSVSLMTMPTDPPAVYTDLLKDAGHSSPTAIVEVPMIYGQSRYYQDQIYMYYSTFHWQRLANGYSGFFPASYMKLAAEMRGFPDARSLDALRQRGVRYAVIHGERMEPQEYDRIVRAIDACACGLTLIASQSREGREISAYRLFR